MSFTKLNFEMTPELDEILRREVREPGRSLLHSSLKSDTQLDGYKVIYSDEMELPEPDDRKAILAWLGLNESVSESILRDYEEHLAGNVPEPYGPVLHQSETPEATLVNQLIMVFLLGIAQEWDFDEAEDFEGYVNSAFAIGLRPEFALRCGLHPEKECTPQEQERWYNHPPSHHVEELVKENASVLMQLWREGG